MKSNSKTWLVHKQLPCPKKHVKLPSKRQRLRFELCWWSEAIFEERKEKLKKPKRSKSFWSNIGEAKLQLWIFFPTTTIISQVVIQVKNRDKLNGSRAIEHG